MPTSRFHFIVNPIIPLPSTAVATLKMRVGMSVEKLSKKLAAVSHRKLLSLQVSVAQLVTVGQLYTLWERHTLHVHVYTSMHGNNMEH